MWYSFAPEKGTDTREKIAEAIRKRGIKLNRKEMENLVDDIADELQSANAESINSTTNNIIAVNSRDILLTMSICKHSARSST